MMIHGIPLMENKMLESEMPEMGIFFSQKEPHEFINFADSPCELPFDRE
jgi:hypothetical protein